MTPARPEADVPTIECVACNGTGMVWGEDENGWRVLVDCPLCHGTGREPATVQPKEQKP